MPKPDFAVARIMHMSWKISFREFLDGKRSSPLEQTVSHEDCYLGKWLYSEGIETYGKIPEMKELEKVHIELHAIMEKILQLKEFGNDAGAENEYKKLEEMSQKIFTLLVIVEKKIE